VAPAFEPTLRGVTHCDAVLHVMPQLVAQNLQEGSHLGNDSEGSDSCNKAVVVLD